jgi:hypothetical protein
MKTILLGGAIALIAATSALADGYSSGSRKGWRGPAYRYSVSYNVITPYYVGYFPGHYSYYRPDPVPSGHYYKPRFYRDGCWVAYQGAMWLEC